MKSRGQVSHNHLPFPHVPRHPLHLPWFCTKSSTCIYIIILHPYPFLTHHTIFWMSLESLLHNMPFPSYFAFLPLWTTVLHPDSSIYLTLMYIHYQTVGLNTIHRFFMHKWIYYGWIHLHDSCTVYCCICDWDVPYASYKNIICIHAWDSRKK